MPTSTTSPNVMTNELEMSCTASLWLATFESTGSVLNLIKDLLQHRPDFEVTDFDIAWIEEQDEDEDVIPPQLHMNVKFTDYDVLEEVLAYVQRAHPDMALDCCT
jgi:hypothetical protein